MCPGLSTTILVSKANQTFVNGKKKGQTIYCNLIYSVPLICLCNFSIIRKHHESLKLYVVKHTYNTISQFQYDTFQIGSLLYLLYSFQRVCFLLPMVSCSALRMWVVSWSSVELLECLILSTHVCKLSFSLVFSYTM